MNYNNCPITSEFCFSLPLLFPCLFHTNKFHQRCTDNHLNIVEIQIVFDRCKNIPVLDCIANRFKRPYLFWSDHRASQWFTEVETKKNFILFRMLCFVQICTLSSWLTRMKSIAFHRHNRCAFPDSGRPIQRHTTILNDVSAEGIYKFHSMKIIGTRYDN